MVYRILYSGDGQTHSGEITVEAHNTVEAMVKFRHACGAGGPARVTRPQVVSICPEPAEDSPPEPADLWLDSLGPPDPPSFHP